MNNNSRDIDLEQKVDAYVKGRLSEEEAEQLWVELMKHPEYIALLQTEIDLSRTYQQPSGKNSYYWKWIAAAAAVILLVVTINVLSPNKPGPISIWTHSNIGIAENMASAEVTRSATTALDPADSLLNTGFKAALSGRVDEAMNIFQGVVKQYDTTRAASKAHLNLGILQYNAGKYSKCVDSFNNAISTAGDDSLLIERSYWYLSNAFVNTNQLKQARKAVEQAFSMGDIYKKQSFKLLKRLDYELGNIDFDNFEQQMKESE